MIHLNPELIDKLAAEYVLGTLHGRARRRFERLLKENPALREEVAVWERRLGPLADAIEPITPPARVWRAVQRRVAAQRPESLWERLGFWRPFGLITGALALTLAVYVGYLGLTSTVTPERYVAMLNNADAQPVWLISATDLQKPLTIKVIKAQTLASDKSFELWLVPGEGKPPRSLGLLPDKGTTTVTIPTDVRRTLTQGALLAVSLEPRGGSPTGLPTGPVLYQGTWQSLG